jgi:pimeloyl-ACP methyl ester carboxylesterase/DNA-binding SARP family transcriptional activator
MSFWRDHPTHYEFYGGHDGAKNEVVVFIHALGFDMSTWDPLWNLFAKQYSVLRYNQIGHGGREYQPLDSVYDSVHELLDLFQLLEIEDVHIVGHGLGGNLGLLFAITHPMMVRSLTLISTHLVVLDPVFDDMLTVKRQFASENTLDQLAAMMAPLVCIDENNQLAVLDSHKRISPDSYFQYISNHTMREYNAIVCEHGSISTPILHLAGEFDAVRQAYIYGITTAMFANARFLVVRNASHAVQMDRPEEVADLIQQFIGDLPNKCWRLPVKPSKLHADIVHRYFNSPLQQNQLNIKLIGDFAVWINGVQITGSWNKRKSRQLLSYLIFNPITARDRLCEELWPFYDFQQAHIYLRVSLYYLKSLLESVCPQQTFLQVGRQSVSLRGNIECDVVKLLSSLQDVIEESNIQLKVDVVQQLMNQLHPDSLALFDDEPWFRTIRAKVESRLVTVIKRLGAYYFDHGQYGLAIDVWEHCLRLDEFDLTIYQRMINSMERLHDATGVRLWKQRRDQIVSDLR